MIAVSVEASNKYDVLIGEGLLGRSGELVKRLVQPCRAVLVSDRRVFALYGQAVTKSLQEAGFTVSSYVFKGGEGEKRLTTVCGLLEFMGEIGATRNSVVFALGGGVTGDLAGFAASAYMRGIRYIQAPTTLLAAVDSSVGGKTGVNLNAGKNLAGAFHQPTLVICDCEAFNTLPEQIFADGVAEAIKYGVIADEELFRWFEDGFPENGRFIPLVERCVRIKARLVAEDEFDLGGRRMLNLGHTVGHAIEALSGYSISHGQAVAIGMAAEARAAWKMGVCEKACYIRLRGALIRNGLEINAPYEPEALYRAALTDKKLSKGEIMIPLPKRIGECLLYSVPAERLLDFMRIGAKP